MSTKPSRRWFQFRLSTWFVLVGLVALSMSLRPYTEWSVDSGAVTSSSPAPPGASVIITVRHMAEVEHTWIIIKTTPNPKLAWPTLGLLALLTWKIAGQIVERRRSRRATAPLT